MGGICEKISYFCKGIMEKNFTYDGITLRYTDCGEGQPLFLLHGWGCDGAIFDFAQPWLTERFRVLTFDLAGFGRSEEPRDTWGVEEYTRSVEAVARHEGIERPILVGHSFGGRVSILFASRNATCKAILVDAAGVKPKRSFAYYRKVYTYKLIKRVLPLVAGRARAERIIDRYRSKSGSSDYNNASPRMRAILSKCVNEDLCRAMPSIKAPTLLFWGENDTATPLADAKKMERLIPDAGLVAVKGAGHFSFLENRGLFIGVMESFLAPEAKKNDKA